MVLAKLVRMMRQLMTLGGLGTTLFVNFFHVAVDNLA
jgi:hypothetical protein